MQRAIKAASKGLKGLSCRDGEGVGVWGGVELGGLPPSWSLFHPFPPVFCSHRPHLDGAHLPPTPLHVSSPGEQARHTRFMARRPRGSSPTSCNLEQTLCPHITTLRCNNSSSVPMWSPRQDGREGGALQQNEWLLLRLLESC